MMCTIRVNQDVLQDRVAYKYYVHKSTWKSGDDGYEDLHIQSKYQQPIVNRRLCVTIDQTGMIMFDFQYFIIFSNMLGLIFITYM